MATVKTQPIANSPALRRGHTESIVSNLLGAGYRVVQNIGQGSAGTIFLARDPQSELVAVKVLHPRLSADAVAVKRFFREANICTRLQHPNLVRSIEAGEHQGTYYLVMEYVPGETLAALMERRKKVPEEEAVNIVAGLAAALKILHDANLVHRDVKPSNVLMTEDGQPKLGDLGLAKDLGNNDLTRPNQSLGTPIYMAPEQFVNAHTVDSRCDLYALGIILYTLTTGELPFPGPQLAALLEAKVRSNFIPPANINPQLSSATIEAIERSIQANPEDRPKSIDEFMSILKPGGVETVGRSSQPTVVVEQPKRRTSLTSQHIPSGPPRTQGDPPASSTTAINRPTLDSSIVPSIPELPSQPELPQVSCEEIDLSKPPQPPTPPTVWYLVLSRNRELVVVQASTASIRRALDKNKLQVHVCVGKSVNGPFVPIGTVPELVGSDARSIIS